MKPRCQHTKARLITEAERDLHRAGDLWFCPKCQDSWKSDPLDRYYTEDAMAAQIVAWALRQPVGVAGGGDWVLEPSAGDGSIVEALLAAGCKVHALDLDGAALKRYRQGSELAEQAERDGRLVLEQCDFLRWKAPEGRRFGLTVMNPPYSHPDGADGRHVARALAHSERVVGLVRANFLHGFTRWHQVFRWARLLRQVVLARRPPFDGPADAGHTARHDYQVLELFRTGSENRTELGYQTEIEFWL